MRTQPSFPTLYWTAWVGRTYVSFRDLLGCKCLRHMCACKLFCQSWSHIRSFPLGWSWSSIKVRKHYFLQHTCLSPPPPFYRTIHNRSLKMCVQWTQRTQISSYYDSLFYSLIPSWAAIQVRVLILWWIMEFLGCFYMSHIRCLTLLLWAFSCFQMHTCESFCILKSYRDVLFLTERTKNTGQRLLLEFGNPSAIPTTAMFKCLNCLKLHYADKF